MPDQSFITQQVTGWQVHTVKRDQEKLRKDHYKPIYPDYTSAKDTPIFNIQFCLASAVAKVLSLLPLQFTDQKVTVA